MSAPDSTPRGRTGAYRSRGVGQAEIPSRLLKRPICGYLLKGWVSGTPRGGRGDGARRVRRAPARLLLFVLFGLRVQGLLPVVPHLFPILMEVPPVVPGGLRRLVEGRLILADRLPVRGAGGAVLLERLPVVSEGRPVGGDGRLVPRLLIRLELLPVLPILLPGLSDGLVLLCERLGVLPEILPGLPDGRPILLQVLPILFEVRGGGGGGRRRRGGLRLRPRDSQGQSHETACYETDPGFHEVLLCETVDESGSHYLISNPCAPKV